MTASLPTPQETAEGTTRPRQWSQRAQQSVRELPEQAALVQRGWRRHQHNQYPLAHFHLDADPTKPVRPELAAQYERARADRAGEANTLDGTLETIFRYGPGVGLAVADAMALSGSMGALWPLPLAATGLWGRYWWCRLRSLGRADRTAEYAEVADADAVAEATNVSAEMLTSALQDAGVLANPNAANAGEKVQLAEPPRHDEHGWQARIVLPGTVPASKVAKAKERVTAALGTNLLQQQVWITVETPRIVSLRVFYRLPFTGEPEPHPLLADGHRLSLRKHGAPVGRDLLGNTVTIDVDNGLHGLVVAASGMGKTVNLVNLVLSILAADDGEVGGIFDGKASGDYDPVRAAADWYLDTEEGGAWWWAGLAELMEREVAIAHQRQQRRRRGDELNLRFVILDEFQVGFGNPGDRRKTKDPETGEMEWTPAARVVQAVEELSRLGRSAGVRLVLASQSFDGNVLPTHILNNVLWRVVGYHSSQTMKPELTLGELAGQFGLATDELFTKSQRGAAIISAPNHQTYAIARGWFQERDEIEQAVATRTSSRPPAVGDADPTPAMPETPAEDEDEAGQAELPPLLAALAAYVGDDDRTLIASGELVEEVNPEGLSPRAYGDALTALGIPKITTDPDTGSSLRRPSRRVADIRSAAGLPN